MNSQSFVVSSDQAGATLAALLRLHFRDQSWSSVRRLVKKRRVQIGNEVCIDPARRLREGETVEVLGYASSIPQFSESLKIRFLDNHLVVVEKPSGLSTVRHPADRYISGRRKHLTPTLEDLVPPLVERREGLKRPGRRVRLRVVHRLDKETSGLLVFARSVSAERELGQQFRAHTVIRRYLAIVRGSVLSRRIASRLVRDRGDGRRGSTSLPATGKEAVTHVEVVENLRGYTLLSCRLETGRTHQIRIHLAELGHPVCGEKVYNRKASGEVMTDLSEAPRLALHATELGFRHPTNGREFHWTMPLPADLREFLEGLDKGSSSSELNQN